MCAVWVLDLISTAQLLMLGPWSSICSYSFLNTLAYFTCFLSIGFSSLQTSSCLRSILLLYTTQLRSMKHVSVFKYCFFYDSWCSITCWCNLLTVCFRELLLVRSLKAAEAHLFAVHCIGLRGGLHIISGYLCPGLFTGSTAKLTLPPIASFSSLILLGRSTRVIVTGRLLSSTYSIELLFLLELLLPEASSLSSLDRILSTTSPSHVTTGYGRFFTTFYDYSPSRSFIWTPLLFLLYWTKMFLSSPDLVRYGPCGIITEGYSSIDFSYCSHLLCLFALMEFFGGSWDIVIKGTVGCLSGNSGYYDFKIFGDGKLALTGSGALDTWCNSDNCLIGFRFSFATTLSFLALASI